MEAAASREIREEFGVVIKNVRVLGSYESSLEYKHDTVYCVAAEMEGDLRASAEFNEIRWFAMDSLPAEISTAVRRSVGFIVARINGSDGRNQPRV